MNIEYCTKVLRVGFFYIQYHELLKREKRGCLHSVQTILIDYQVRIIYCTYGAHIYWNCYFEYGNL